jgi:hypothetical protein
MGLEQLGDIDHAGQAMAGIQGVDVIVQMSGLTADEGMGLLHGCRHGHREHQRVHHAAGRLSRIRQQGAHRRRTIDRERTQHACRCGLIEAPQQGRRDVQRHVTEHGAARSNSRPAILLAACAGARWGNRAVAVSGSIAMSNAPISSPGSSSSCRATSSGYVPT